MGEEENEVFLNGRFFDNNFYVPPMGRKKCSFPVSEFFFFFDIIFSFPIEGIIIFPVVEKIFEYNFYHPGSGRLNFSVWKMRHPIIGDEVKYILRCIWYWVGFKTRRSPTGDCGAKNMG